MMETTPEIESLLDRFVAFVLQYRNGKAFKNYTEEQVRENLHAAMLNMTMIYCCDPDNSICALVHGRKIERTKKFYVDDILSKPNRPNILNIFLTNFAQMFPGYDIVAHRRGKWVSYDTKKLLKKCIKISYSNN